jgi:peptide subunit release factor 1 (eRF1)
MATDPTQRIQRQDTSTGLATELRAIGERLAAIEPSIDVPIVTATLDWRIEGTNPGRSPFYAEGARPDNDRYRSQPDRPGEERDAESARRRPARRVFQDRMDAILEAHGEHDEVAESLRGDAERIAAYLDGEADPSAQGILVVSCSAKGVFEAFSIGVPLPTNVAAGPTATIATLARAAEDHPPYAIVLADSEEARLTLVSHTVAARSVEMEGSEYPRKQQQGGWSQRRYQARADEKLEAFARDVAEETRVELERYGIDMLVLAGAEEMLVALERELASAIRDRIIGTVPLEMRSTEREMIDAAAPLVAQAEREHEREAVQAVSDGIGASTNGAAGASDVLTALQAGQVMTLVMNDDFRGEGWADFTMPAYGVGDLPTSHPLGGEVANIVSVELRDELVRLALLSGAEVEIVHTDIPPDAEEFQTVPQEGGEAIPRSDAAIALDAVGGVGAVLRYVIGDEPTEEESAAQAQDDDRR